MTERETLLAEIAEKQARLAELDALDPLLIEARVICSSAADRDGCEALAADFCDGSYDAGGSMFIALAALRRGMEIAKAPPMGSVMGEAEWIEWHGGSCPLPKKTPIEVRFRDGRTARAWAGYWHSSWLAFKSGPAIIAYRILGQQP